MNTRSSGQIWLITGPREVGKTRFCIHLIEKARALGMTLAGLICPPEYDGDLKISIRIENLATGEKAVLAQARTSELEGVLTDRWAFDPVILDWGNQVLGNIPPCDLLVVDELGPLEFTQGQGWQNGLVVLDRGNFQTALVVIRPELIPTACNRWPAAKILEIPAGLNELAENQLQEMIFTDYQVK
jgi:nucleoside-triphosphatase